VESLITNIKGEYMKVAFDCQGTLILTNEANKLIVHKLFKWFESKGCEMVVWSNGGAPEILVKTLKLNATAQSKSKTWELEGCENPEQYYMDIAVDDDVNQTYLAAKNFIWVRDIPDESKFENTYGHFFLRSK
jgi:hypothetical protein